MMHELLLLVNYCSMTDYDFLLNIRSKLSYIPGAISFFVCASFFFFFLNFSSLFFFLLFSLFARINGRTGLPRKQPQIEPVTTPK